MVRTELVFIVRPQNEQTHLQVHRQLTEKINLSAPHIGAVYSGAACTKILMTSKKGDSFSEILWIPLQICDQRSLLGWPLNFLRVSAKSDFEVLQVFRRSLSDLLRLFRNFRRALRKVALGLRQELVPR